MRRIIVAGISVFVGGFILCILLTRLFGEIPVEFTYYYGILFSILYLASILTVCTFYIGSLIKKNTESLLNRKSDNYK